jgi:LacI family transcriptional regulator
VSTATVSNALNDVRGVGADVRERVLAAARELGYRPNVAAQATRTGRTRQMAFITPDLTNPFYPRLARAVANAARAAGYALLLVDTQDGEAELACIEQIARHDVDGILWCPATARMCWRAIGWAHLWWSSMTTISGATASRPITA